MLLSGFPTIGKFWSYIFSESIDFPSNAKGDAPSHLRDYLRDASWEDFFKLDTSVAFSTFCKWVQVNIDVYIFHRKFQAKPHLSH